MPATDYRLAWYESWGTEWMAQGHFRWKNSRQAAERMKRYWIEERDVSDIELLARTFQPREDENDG